MKAARRSRRAFAISATAAITIITCIAPPAEASTVTARPHLLSRSVTHTLNGYVTTLNYSNSRVRIYSSSGPATMRTATSKVMSGDGKVVHEESGEVVVPGVSKTDVAAAALRAKSIPSDVTILHALGAPKADAARFAAVDQVPSFLTGGTGTALHRPTSSVRPLAATASDPPPGELVSANCANADYDWNSNINNGPGRPKGNYMGHVHFCSNQYLVRDLGGGNWRLYDRFKATGSMHDFSSFNPDEVTGLLAGIHYSYRNYINDWSPDASWHPSGCATKTANLSVLGVEVGYSSSACEYSEGYYYSNQTLFETKWNGDGDGPSDGARATWGHCDIQSPAGASSARTLLWHYWYE